MISQGGGGDNRIEEDLFYFTEKWIRNQPTKNPISESLFSNIQQNLEREILDGKKKRIFQRGELIQLQPATILEVVKKMEDYDLHAIDEDLNGRMFETFLNATVRGKELGQYFTPRPVVKYMIKSAQLKIENEKLPLVIDACCGSGGFLIEALSELSIAIDNSSQLTDKDKCRLRDKLQRDTIYGIEANDKVGRVARLNMYLHGDGGSRIYIADTLDKNLSAESGLDNERRQQLDELHTQLNTKKILFDVVLTNPPFSMSYRKKVENEKRVLKQYEIAVGGNTKSNVLFIERYRDLLKESGELLTVIDDTVLNGINSDAFRRFIRDNFIVRQVISLPFNTFKRAEAGCKTSILHLRKKRHDEHQGDVFMAIANNVGHDHYKKDTPHRDNLPELSHLFREWDTKGSVPDLYRENDMDEPLGCPLEAFVVPSDKLQDERLDAFYYSPHLSSLRHALAEKEKAGEILLKRGRDFHIAQSLSKANKREFKGKDCKYIEIGDITQDGFAVKCSDALFEELPTRVKWRTQSGDVLFAKNISSRGTAILISNRMAGTFATSGFISVRPRDEEEGLILWSVFRSEIWRRQIYYLSITATQPEIRDEIFKDEMVIPWPVSENERSDIINSARSVLSAQEKELEAGQKNRQLLDDLFLS